MKICQNNDYFPSSLFKVLRQRHPASAVPAAACRARLAARGRHRDRDGLRRRPHVLQELAQPGQGARLGLCQQ